MAYHWLTSSTSAFTPPINSGSIAPAGIVIPANARLVRWQIRDCIYQGQATAHNLLNIGALWVDLKVLFTAGPYSGRAIYNARKAIPMELTGLYDGGLLLSTYVAWYNAADEVFGANEKVSYGGAGKASSTLTLQATLFASVPGSVIVTPTGYVSTTLAALYEL